MRAPAEPAPSATLHFGVPGLLLLEDPGASENGEPRSCLCRVLAGALDAAPGLGSGRPFRSSGSHCAASGVSPKQTLPPLRAQSSHSGPEDLRPQSEASAPVAHHPGTSQTHRDQQPSYDRGRPSASAGNAGHRLQGLPLCGRIKARGPGVPCGVLSTHMRDVMGQLEARTSWTPTPHPDTASVRGDPAPYEASGP